MSDPRPSRAAGTARDSRSSVDVAPAPTGGTRAAEARERLLAATLRCAIRDGGGALSLQAIAREAGVSKALILYHFRDKEALLAAVIRWLDTRIQEREGGALFASSATTVLEDYWRWIQEELSSGELLVLLELSQARGEECRLALRDSAERRRRQAEATVGRIFSLLELTPRLPVAMLASCERAFREGLALSSAPPLRVHDEQGPRVAFDVFWLSLLSLTR